LVGKTSNSADIVGGIIRANGLVNGCSDSNYSAIFTRNTNDGDIVLFRKDGTTVGSIGTSAAQTNSLVIDVPNNGSALIFEGSNTSGTTTRLAMSNAGGSEAFRPFNADSDALFDLGSGTRRFKNLYLSGGVYLGGTAAANHLDDYEEGTWTPVLSDGTSNATASTAVGTYTKIGRMVHVKGTLIISSLGSISGSLLLITGLPFTTSSAVNTSASANFGYGQGLNLTAGTSLSGYLNTGNTRIVVQSWDAAAGTTNTTPAEWSADGGAHFDATYYI